MNDIDPWEGLLDPDEKIVWQGAPAAGVRLEWRSPMEGAMGLFFVGFSTFWMIMASAAPGPFWMFGLLFFGIGLYNLAGVHFWKAYHRRNTFYTLTNKRAFIASQTSGKRKLQSYPIGPEAALSIDEGRLSDIWFAEQYTPNSKSGSTTKKIGFERLDNGREVFAKFREVQRAALAGPHDA
jgi:hypothetical protein